MSRKKNNAAPEEILPVTAPEKTVQANDPEETVDAVPEKEMDEKMRGYSESGGPPDDVSGNIYARMSAAESADADSGLRRYYGYEKAKRRAPAKGGYFRILAIITGVLLVLVLAASAVFWILSGIYAEGTPEAFMDGLVSSTDADGWRTLLRSRLPETYPPYEDAAKLAAEILSPAFTPGRVTYLPDVGGEDNTFLLFSDGVRFARMTLNRTRTVVGDSGEWEIGRLEFDRSYFSGVAFLRLRVTVPDGAELRINSVVYSGGAASEKKVCYPGLSVAEENAPENCTELIFDDIYFPPAFSASLSGTELERVDTADGCWFRFPDSLLHDVKVTVPAGAKGYVGGVELDESWASRETVYGELGSLDDGGTGTLPELSVWTVKGLTGKPSVRAEAGGKEIALLSENGNEYVFETPPECRYTVTVTVPSGASVTVNGRPAGESALLPAGGGELLADGGTFWGKYGSGGLPGSGFTPGFDCYRCSGYLAVPVVRATLDGKELTPATERTEGFDVRVEYDLPASDGESPDAGALAAAEEYLADYVRYVSGGGGMTDRSNADAFNNNYDALLAKMIEGTAGYIGVMESYREVNLLPGYDVSGVGPAVIERFVRYGEECTGLLLTAVAYRGNYPEDVPGAQDPAPGQEEDQPPEGADPDNPGPAPEGSPEAVTESFGVRMSLLIFRGADGWRVLGFDYTETEIPQENPAPADSVITE